MGLSKWLEETKSNNPMTNSPCKWKNEKKNIFQRRYFVAWRVTRNQSLPRMKAFENQGSVSIKLDEKALSWQDA